MYLQNSISGHTSQQQKVGDGGHFNKCNSNVKQISNSDHESRQLALICYTLIIHN